MELFVEPHLQWRMLSADDLGDLEGLRAQLVDFDDMVMPGVDRLLHLQNAQDLPTNCVGGWDRFGSLLAYGWVIPDTSGEIPKLYLLGGVHPAQRWTGIGTAVLDWEVARATEWVSEHGGGAHWLGCFVEDGQESLAHGLERRGFAAERYFFDMYRHLSDLPEPSTSDGISFTTYEVVRSEEVRRLHNLCFADRFDADGVSEEDWLTSLDGDGFRPDWSWLALADDEVVGYALSGIDAVADSEGVVGGWTDRVGVHPQHRGRDISTGLLRRTLQSMAASGCTVAGIGVDSADPHASEALHGLLDYETRDAVVLMGKEVAAPVSVA